MDANANDVNPLSSNHEHRQVSTRELRSMDLVLYKQLTANDSLNSQLNNQVVRNSKDAGINPNNQTNSH